MGTIKKIELSNQIPRAAGEYPITFDYGMQTERLILFIIMLGSLLLTINILYQVFIRKEAYTFLLLAILMFAASFLCFRRIQTIRNLTKNRQEVFMRGKPIKATVIAHSRHMVYYKSKQDYTLHMLIENPRQSIKVKTSPNLYKALPNGTAITALKQGENYLFGPEINYLFVIK